MIPDKPIGSPAKHEETRFVDAMTIKKRRSPWSIIVPIALTGLSLWFLTEHLRTPNPYDPGVWAGQLSYQSGMMPFFWGSVLLFCATIIALSCMRIILAVLIVVGSVCLIKTPAIRPRNSEQDASLRYGIEIPQYKKAIANGDKFGDQTNLQIEGRSVTYWRWATRQASGGGVGIIHDPKDELEAGDAQTRLFGKLTVAQKIEPGWYFVRTSFD